MLEELEQESIINEDSLVKLEDESIEEWFNRISFPKCKECTVSKDRPYRYQVYPKGPIDASIVLVGEAPGKQEEEEGEAFVGPAGQKLEEALVNAGVDSSQFYITNTIKCRPLENRAPVAEECKKCRDLFLKHEINAYPRKLVIGVGNIGYYGVVPKRTPSGIMSRSGIFEENEEFNCLVLPCVHPAAVLRTPSNQPLLDDVAVKIAQFINNNYNLQEKTPVNYKEVRTIADFNKCIKEIKEKKLLVVDLETQSLDYFKGRILCISISTASYTGWYIPVIENDDSAWSRYDWTIIQEGLREVFEDPTINKIGHNLKFDLEFLIHNFKWKVKGQLDDTMLMHHMLDENTAHGLKDLSTRLTDLGSYAIELEEAFNVVKRSRIPIEEKHFGKIPTDILIKYTCTDVDATFRLYKLFNQQLIEQGLYDTYRNVVMDVMPVLMKMEMTGVRIDKTKIDELKIELKQQIDELHIKISSYLPGKDKKKLELEQKIKNVEEAQDFYMSSALTTPKKLWELKKQLTDLNTELTNLGEPEINIKSVPQLRKLLYDDLKLPILKKTDKGEASTDEETLTLLQEKTNHPILTDLLQFRELSKLYSTYVVGLDELISPDGRIHTSYLQHRTVTGRLASTDPNTQNIPRESTIRQLFTATEGWYFVIADFKQAELRVWSYCSQDEQFIQALTTSNVHNVIGARLLNKPEDKITKEEKNRVKQAVFGVAYGRGTHSLAAEWKMSYQEAQAFIDKFFAMMPKAYQWLLDQEDFAKKNGYVKSIFGRIRRLPMINSSEESLKAQALRFARNAPIQSASSDLTNLSLIRIDREFERLGMKSRLLMQVHDSVAIESPPEEVKEAVAIMQRCMTTPPFPEFNVPLAADIEVSDRWGGDKINLDDL
jgi:DNA polymerase-1